MARAAERFELPPLQALLELAGPRAILLEHRTSECGDGVFHDLQHDVEMNFIDDAVKSDGLAFLKALREHEFEMPGLMVAQSRVTRARYCPGRREELFVAVQLVVLDLGWLKSAPEALAVGSAA